jgi:6-hydroxy-3-succinoylpyridine 3-monooxygenase
MRTRVYVDGFNLFYGALSKSACKWLDLYALFHQRVLDPPAQVDRINYYTRT